MRNVLVLFCIAVQLGVLGYMVYGREAVVRSGQRISMATAPIDPRDPFRGDFVRLRYPLNNLLAAPNQWSTPDYSPRKGDIIFAVLEQKQSGLYEVSHFVDKRPESGVYIRGRSGSGNGVFRSNSNQVRFGIEQLYVEQGSGIEIERKRGVRGGLQTAMEVQLALDQKGVAVITDYRWSQLAIKLQVTDDFALNNEANSPVTNSSDINTEDAPQLIVTLQNVSDKALTLNNPGDNCGFRLEPANRVSDFKEAANSCAGVSAVVPLTLAPGQLYSFSLHLASPRWYVTYTDEDSTSTGDLRTLGSATNEMLRVVYRGSSDRKSDLELWQGDLLSQAFNARGRID